MQMKKNIVISIVVIAVLIAYLVVNKLSVKKVVEMPKVEDITQITIAKGNTTIIIKKDGDSWKVNEFEADKNVIANMVNKLKDLTVTDIISEKPHYERFELDNEHAVHVKAQSDGKVVRDIYIGKKGSTYRHTYIRLEGDPKVYLALDTLDSYFNKTVDDLRNKDIVQVDIAKIESVHLYYKNSAITLEKKVIEKKGSEKKDQKDKQKDEKSQVEKTEQWVCKEHPEVTIDNDKVKEILYTFDPVKAYSYPDIDIKALKGKIAEITVKVKDGEQQFQEVTLTVHKEYENNRYICTCSKSPYVFTMDEWRVKRLFKTLPDLKK